MTNISTLFNHFMNLINIRYYTKTESDNKYLKKQDFGLIIDNEGVLRIVTEDDDDVEGNNVYVGDLYALKSEVPSQTVNFTVTYQDGTTETIKLYKKVD